MQSSKILEGEVLGSSEKNEHVEQKVREFEQFRLLKHNENTVFGDAKYEINMSRQTA